jgi:hypothetical protein
VSNLNKKELPASALFRDRVLFALIIAYVPVFYFMLYYGNHNQRLLAVAAIFAAVISYLVLVGYVVSIVIVRIFRLYIHRSLALLSCVALLMLLPLGGSKATALIDTLRFYSTASDYRALTRENSSSQFQAFDWGSSGFAGQNNFYYLIFDSTGETSGGPISNSMTASARLLPNPNCTGSITHLSGHFYSLAVFC